MKKGSNSITEYINKARILADEMALAGKKIDNEELISYIFISLGFKYNSIVSALVARPSTLSIGEVLLPTTELRAVHRSCANHW
jgi:hypothetical protein